MNKTTSKTQYDSLNSLQQSQVDKAVKKITIDILNSLTYGDEIKISDNVVIYHYTEEEIVVLNIYDEWIEVYQYLWDNESKEIITETL